MAFDRIMDLVHGYWAYLVILMVTLATFNALIKFFANKPFGESDFRVSLFALIVTHIQFLLGIVMYFSHPSNGFGALSNPELTMKDIMGSADLRLFTIEHPLVMLLAIIFLTIGYSKHKKQLTSKAKFKTLAVFYTIAFILIVSRIPWSHWLTGSH